MFKGFYNLTSGMLSQGRRLDVVSNNMANVSTVGYKADLYTDSTFQEYLLSRVGNKDKTGSQIIGDASFILAPSHLYTDYGQGALEPTGMPLDFAIDGDAFFGVQGAGGGVTYSRNGSFSLDFDGYLTLPGEGRVLSAQGQPIWVGSDRITADSRGNLYSPEGEFLGQLGLYSFADNGQLARNDRGLLVGGGAGAAGEDVVIHWKTVERSNIDLVEQMVDMITSQRALQSAAQLSKMYNQLMTKTNELAGL